MINKACISRGQLGLAETFYDTSNKIVVSRGAFGVEHRMAIVIIRHQVRKGTTDINCDYIRHTNILNTIKFNGYSMTSPAWRYS